MSSDGQVDFSAVVRPEHAGRDGHMGDVARDTLALLQAFCGPDPAALQALLDNLACPDCTCASLALSFVNFGEHSGRDMAATVANWQAQARRDPSHPS